MNAVRQVTVNPNDLVFNLYPGLRSRLKESVPFLDEEFGNHLADQSLRHVLNRVTTHRSDGTFTGSLETGEAICLARQMASVGQLPGNRGTNGIVIGLLADVQSFALDAVRGYEIKNDVEITGQEDWRNS